MVIISIILGVIYLPIIFETSIGTAYTDRIPKELQSLWEIIPLMIVISVIAFIMGKTGKELIKLFLVANIVSTTTYFLFYKMVIVSI
jgi:hypothetical protein